MMPRKLQKENKISRFLWAFVCRAVYEILNVVCQARDTCRNCCWGIAANASCHVRKRTESWPQTPSHSLPSVLAERATLRNTGGRTFVMDETGLSQEQKTLFQLSSKYIPNRFTPLYTWAVYERNIRSVGGAQHSVLVNRKCIGQGDFLHGSFSVAHFECATHTKKTMKKHAHVCRCRKLHTVRWSFRRKRQLYLLLNCLCSCVQFSDRWREATTGVQPVLYWSTISQGKQTSVVLKIAQIAHRKRLLSFGSGIPAGVEAQHVCLSRGKIFFFLFVANARSDQKKKKTKQNKISFLTFGQNANQVSCSFETRNSGRNPNDVFEHHQNSFALWMQQIPLRVRLEWCILRSAVQQQQNGFASMCFPFDIAHIDTSIFDQQCIVLDLQRPRISGENKNIPLRFVTCISLSCHKHLV